MSENKVDHRAPPDSKAEDAGDGASGQDASHDSEHPPGHPSDRRQFLSTISRVAMAGGLVAGYGTCAALSGRFLYPSKDRPTAWQFVIEAERLPAGAALAYRAPDGAPINIARRGTQGVLSDFIALSSTCPHLGCRVHWQPQENRFFCPCHNGVFTPEGKAVSGPPADAGQSLERYPLELDNGLLFIKVPMDEEIG